MFKQKQMEGLIKQPSKCLKNQVELLDMKIGSLELGPNLYRKIESLKLEPISIH